MEYQAHVSEQAAHNIQSWLEEPKYAQYEAEVQELIAAEQWQQLEDAFFKVIEFGTGGRRGMVGVGSNRINRVTIGESVQALCVYAQQELGPMAAEMGVVIACDTRLSSPELSKYAALVAAAAGFKTYIFDSFRSTPELSFAVRDLGCAIGIVISASHNPPSDNGIKAYWSDGGQLVAPHDKGVLTIADTITRINAEADFDECIKRGSITIVSSETDQKYIAAVVGEAVGEERELDIVYSPLHGAGQTNTLPVLRAAGFSTITTVEEQMVPDGNFPTIENGKPNPEEKSANDRAVALMLDQNADIAITNDPDADRIGVIVRQGDEAVYLNGNQSAVLATEYSLRKLHESGQLTAKHFIAKTIVTTEMMKAIADKYNVTTYSNMLVGFKYIGKLLLEKESSDEIFVIGGEESYGLLKGTYARDKDGAVGALPLAEYAAELKKDDKTLWGRLLELYGEYGLYLERLDNLQCPGADGFKQMQTIMDSLRQQPPHEIDGQIVTAVLDYATLVKKDLQRQSETLIDCEKGDVLVYELGDSRRRITIRPSGTEPKMKFYVQWFSDTINPEEDYNALQQQLENLSRHMEGIALARG